MARRTENTKGLATMVCVTCGAEQFFDKQVPAALTCNKCGATVFRQFMTPTSADDATIAQLEEQARSIQYGDPSPQTSIEEVRDLDNGQR